MKPLALIALLALSACATVTSKSTQDIRVTTDPDGAACTLTNGLGSWNIDHTPGTAAVHRSFTPLKVVCAHEGESPMTATLEPRTRGRAYGNILLLGLPAGIDAATGYGYEYEPDDVSFSRRDDE